ncbi:gag/pol protein [Gossypium australe]|uniref:Gag/pol protein n=1 Tax=Gossypium australe TaxID=47621 RepID=A0A5B6WT49_9ROSI|nr:gag/pol protein [Gossypium australe]
MKAEMDSMYSNSLWELVDLPEEIKSIGYGNVETYKVRLVAKGYTPKEALDYEIQQMDVKTTFLNNYLEESIYMMHPIEYIAKGNKHKLSKLFRFIYGLKQASYSWNQRFDQVIKNFGFEKNVDEPCVYKYLGDEKVVFLVLYVDDIQLIINYIGTLSLVKLWLTQQFSMKDLGESNFVLGIRILMDRKNKVIALSHAS